LSSIEFNSKVVNATRTLYALLIAVSLLSSASAQANDDPVAVWIDVRTWVEYQADHIDGDQRIHVSEVVEGVKTAYPDKNTRLRLYCAVGGRAGEAEKMLKEAGYTDVQNMGGIDDVRKQRGL
jgi:phage shock protein E